MLRLDESEWVPIHSAIHVKKDPWEVIPVNLSFPADKVIIAVNQIEVKIDWHKAGWVYQRWQRMMTSVRVVRSYLPLNEFFKLDVEPVENSILWFQTVTWLPEFQIVVEARRFKPQEITVPAWLESEVARVGAIFYEVFVGVDPNGEARFKNGNTVDEAWWAGLDSGGREVEMGIRRNPDTGEFEVNE